MKPKERSAHQAFPLIRTKVHVPRAQNLLSRPRLLGFLHENIHRKLLLISAGPGYGKTSLLVDFARTANLPVCWYTLDSTDRDPRVFLDYIVEAIRVHYPSFGEKTRALLSGSEAVDLHSIVGTLVNELVEDVPEYIVMILDEFQTVEAEDPIIQVLDLLLQYLPENVHLIVSGRTVPPLPVIQLVAYSEAAGLGNEALCFTPDEIQEFLRCNYDLYLGEEEIRRLVELSEGWVTGILLAVQATWQGMAGLLARAHGPLDHVYAYLTGEVVRHLSPDIQDFLRKTSILEGVEASFCDALLERKDSAGILEFLERRNLFLTPLEHGWYRFHGLFREFLLQQAAVDPDELVRLRERAAALWEERGDLVAAIELLLQACAYGRAARLIDSLAQELFISGRHATLLRWIEVLPPAVRAEQPRLLRFCGKAYLTLDRMDEARAALQQAEGAFARQGDTENWVLTVADLSTLERLRGVLQEAWELAQKALAQASESDAVVLADLHRTLGICLFHQGDLAQAETHLRTAVELALASDLPYSQALAYQGLGVCLSALGRMGEAEQSYQVALRHWRGIGNPGPLANILNNVAIGPFLRGDFDQAGALLQQALEFARSSLSPRIESLVLASRGDLDRDLGNLVAARRAYQEGLEQARQIGSIDLTTYLLEALGNLARQEQKPSAARRSLEEALAAIVDSPRSRARVQLSLAFLAVAEGRAAEALELSAAARAILLKSGEKLQLLRSLLVQALAWHQQHHGRQVEKALEEALELARETGAWEPFFAEKALLRPVLSSPRLQARTAWQELYSRLYGDAGQPVQTNPRPQVRVMALGPEQVWSGERELTARDWVARQTREFFLYIFFQPAVRREQVGLLFWPDQDNAHMSSTFHATLYRARRALGVPFLVFEDGLYRWSPDVDRWSDVEEFEQLLAQADRKAMGDEQRLALLEQAVALYRGDFLEQSDGEWALARREELHVRCLEALLELGAGRLGKEADKAEAAYQRAMQIDPLNEEAYQGLMRCYLEAGDRARAIRVYQRCRRRLQEELDITPSPETEALYRSITV